MEDRQTPQVGIQAGKRKHRRKLKSPNSKSKPTGSSLATANAQIQVIGQTAITDVLVQGPSNRRTVGGDVTNIASRSKVEAGLTQNENHNPSSSHTNLTYTNGPSKVKDATTSHDIQVMGVIDSQNDGQSNIHFQHHEHGVDDVPPLDQPVAETPNGTTHCITQSNRSGSIQQSNTSSPLLEAGLIARLIARQRQSGEMIHQSATADTATQHPVPVKANDMVKQEPSHRMTNIAGAACGRNGAESQCSSAPSKAVDLRQQRSANRCTSQYSQRRQGREVIVDRSGISVPPAANTVGKKFKGKPVKVPIAELEGKSQSDLDRPGDSVADTSASQNCKLSDIKKPGEPGVSVAHCEAQSPGIVAQNSSASTRVSRIPLDSSSSLDIHHKPSLRSPSTHHQILQNAVPCNFTGTVANTSPLSVKPNENLSKQCQCHYKTTATKDHKAKSEPSCSTERWQSKSAYDDKELEGTPVPCIDRLNGRELDCSRGPLWPSEMTMTEIDWAARRAEFEQRLKLGHFGRPKVSTVPPNVDESAAPTSHDLIPKSYAPTSLDPAASGPEKPIPTQAPELEKSRDNANYDSAPVNSSGPHDGSKGELKDTSTSLKVNEPPILRRTSQAPVVEKENPEDLPPHLRLLAMPHNASISNKTQAIGSRSEALFEPAAAGPSGKQSSYSQSLTQNIDQSLPTDPDEVFVPPKPKRVKPPTDWEQFLPENLRNLEKPAWMVERDAKRAEEAAKMPPPPTEQELWQEVLRRNKIAYRPVVVLPKRQSLVLEPSENEKTGGTRLTQDVARDPSRIYSDPAKATNQPVYWRWFSGNPQIPEVGGEETGGPDNDLADPNGEWIPATLEWLEREQYTTTPKQIEHMEKWIAARVAELLEAPYNVDTADPDWLSGELPASGTRKQWQDHPKDLAYRRTPIEYGSMDWNTVPTLPPMKDLYSLTPERRAQNAEASVKTFCEEWYAAKKKRKEEKEKRRLEAERDKEANEQQRAIEEAEFHKRQQLWLDFLAKFAPKANIFIRPAIATDVAQIVAIYNHYVLNTIQADELEETNSGEWRDRLYEASDDKLPFLVAVLKSNKTTGCRNHTGRVGKRTDRHPFVRPKDSAGVFSETVVGFVFAEFISTRNSMYRHAVELHLYVDPTHTRQGVGRTLIDRIMPALDVAYTSRAVTDFLVDPNADRGIQWYQTGGSKEVRKIQINVPYKYGGEKDLEWRKKFLHYWEFDQIGTMECIAEKFGEPVNIAMMLRETAMTTNGCSTWYHKEPPRITHMERRREAVRKAEGDEAADSFIY